MGMALLGACFLVLVFGGGMSVEGVDHIVGGNFGWSPSVDYKTWASSQTFTVGDNLVFKYDASKHKVRRVNEEEYNSCSSSSNNAPNAFGNGNTNIALSSAGKMYFVCTEPGQCGGGMKLAINVVGAAPHNGAHHAHAFAFGAINLLMGSLLLSTIILAFMG